MTFTSEGKWILWAHAWLDMDDFCAEAHFLMFIVTLKNHSFETNLFSAPIVKFFKSTWASNRQIGESALKGFHYSSTSSFDCSNLITVFIESNCKWICCSKKLFENLEWISLELISSLETKFLVWNTILHKSFAKFIIILFKFGSWQNFISFTNFCKRIGSKGQSSIILVFIRMVDQSQNPKSLRNFRLRSVTSTA